MKYLSKTALLIASAAFLLNVPVSAQAADGKDDVMKAAKAYEKTTPIVEMLRKTADASIERAPERQKEKLRIVFNTLDKGKIRSDVLGLMAKHFTAEELHALAEFYGSDVGQTISEKFPEYMAEANNVIQKSIMEAIIEVGKQQEQQNSAR